MTLHPLQWKCGVLTAGPPGKSPSSDFQLCFHHNFRRSALRPRQWGPRPPTVTLLQLCPSPWGKESGVMPVPLCSRFFILPARWALNGFQCLHGPLFWIPPLGGGSSLQHAHPRPDGCSRGSCAEGQSWGFRPGCPGGREVGKPQVRGYTLIPATQVKGGPGLRTCPPVGSCRYILPPPFGLKFLVEKRFDINSSQSLMA